MNTWPSSPLRPTTSFQRETWHDLCCHRNIPAAISAPDDTATDRTRDTRAEMAGRNGAETAEQHWRPQVPGCGAARRFHAASADPPRLLPCKRDASSLRHRTNSTGYAGLRTERCRRLDPTRGPRPVKKLWSTVRRRRRSALHFEKVVRGER